MDNRTAKIKIANFLGQDFHLNCGIPQVSVLTLTLFTIYTTDAPSATHGLNISYANDISQITTHHGCSKKFLFRKTDTEALKINKYENIWKIKTNLNKLKILRLGAHREEEITIGDNILNTKASGKILGPTITNSGYNKYIK